MTMRQVTKEDFEVLSKYHPAEIRYFADTSVEIKRRKPSRVTVKRPPKSPVAARPNVVRGQFIQLTTKDIGATAPSTVKYNVYTEVKRALENDPTKVMRRTELTQAVDKAMPNYSKKSQIVPTITTLLRNGQLRYTGAAQ